MIIEYIIIGDSMEMLKKIFILFLGIVVILPCFVNADTEIDSYKDAVVTTALAYVAQGNQVQYDSYRKNFYATPEDATSQHIVYTVCSGFTYQAYYQALGVKLPDTTEKMLAFAKDNFNNENYGGYVLAYYDSDSSNNIPDVFSTSGLGTESSGYNENLVAEWSKFVQPGDLVVYSGHVMLVEKIDGSNIRLAEATRGDMKYDYVKHEDKYEEADRPTLKSDVSLKAKLKLRYEENDIIELAVIRPIIKNGDSYSYLSQTGSESNLQYNEIEFVPQISDATKSRMKYQDIDIEKIAIIENNPGQQILANVGEEITYKLTIKNNSSNDYSKFNVVEFIDSNVEVVDNGNGTLSSNKLQWNDIVVKAGKFVEITYKVKIPLDKNLFGKIIVSEGKVDNIATSRIETYIGNKFTTEEKNKILNVDLSKVDSYENNFINDIYYQAFGVDLGLGNIKNNLDIISYDKKISYGGGDKLSVKRTKVNDVPVAKYIYNNFYGLRTFAGVSTKVNNERDCPDSSLVRITLNWNNYPTYELNDRARDLTRDMLDDGDIVLLYTNDGETKVVGGACPTEELENRAYIYLNGELVRKLEDGSFEKIVGDELTVFLRNIMGDNYVVLKPSLVFGSGIDQFSPIYTVNITWDDLTFDWAYNEEKKSFGWEAHGTCEEVYASDVEMYNSLLSNGKDVLYLDNKCMNKSNNYNETVDTYYKKYKRSDAYITIEDLSERGQVVPTVKWNSNERYNNVNGVFKYLGNKCVPIETKAVYDVALDYGIYSDSNCTKAANNNGFEKNKYYALALSKNVITSEELPDNLRHNGDYGDETIDGVSFGGFSYEGKTNIYSLYFNLENKSNLGFTPVQGEQIGSITISFKAKE